MAEVDRSSGSVCRGLTCTYKHLDSLDVSAVWLFYCIQQGVRGIRLLECHLALQHM